MYRCVDCCLYEENNEVTFCKNCGWIVCYSCISTNHFCYYLQQNAVNRGVLDLSLHPLFVDYNSHPTVYIENITILISQIIKKIADMEMRLQKIEERVVYY